MADQNPSPKAQDPEPTVHAYDNPHLGPRAFLLAVMHSAEVPIRDRIRAASELLRIYGEESFRPRLTYRIEGIPDCYSLSTEAEVGPTDGTTEIGSHVSPGSHIAPRHSDDNPGPSTLREHPDPL